MKYTIIIPTYRGHSTQIEQCLASFDKFLTDAQDVGIHLIVSTAEVSLFEAIVKKFPALHVTVTSLKTILKAEEDVNIEEGFLLERVGKFNFQSLKKIYAVKHFGTDLSLVLDSEALLLRETTIGTIFETYRKDKFIIHASPSAEQIKRDVARISFELLGKPYQDIWFFEYYYWFFEKKYVDELFSYVFHATGKSIYANLLYRKPIFEYNLYSLYLYLFHADEYRFIDAAEILKKYLPAPTFDTYVQAVGGVASFEYCCWGITEENTKLFSTLFSDLHMSFFRYDDRQGSSDAQVAFLEKNPNIVLLTSRMVTKPFSIDGYEVPASIGTDADSAAPAGNNMLRGLQRRATVFSRKARGKLRETFLDIAYQALLPFKLDNERMILQYPLSSGSPKVAPDLGFDVGAYTGTSLKRMRTLGYKNVICFEPSYRTFARLYARHHNDAGVSYIQRAVSDVSGQEITLYENRATPTLTTTESTWFSIPRHNGLVGGVTQSIVRTITLDEVIKKLGVVPAYIKIDVEGHELAVLKGLHHKPDMLSFEWISERKEHNIEALRHVHDMGFKKFYLMPEEALPTYEAGTERTFEEVLAEWNKGEGMDTGNAESPWGNIWCR